MDGDLCKDRAWKSIVSLKQDLLQAAAAPFDPAFIADIVGAAAGADLNTSENREGLRDALVHRGLTVDEFNGQVQTVLGIHVVPTNAPKNVQGSQIPDTDNNAYLGLFLTWGTSNRDALRQALTRVFKNPDAFAAYSGQIIQTNCMRSVDVPNFAGQYLHRHPPADVFAKYLTKTPAPDVKDWKRIHIGKYDFDELNNMGVVNIHARRGIAMNRGFERTARLQYLLTWIVRTTELIDKTKAAIRESIQNVDEDPTNPLLTYLKSP